MVIGWENLLSDLGNERVKPPQGFVRVMENLESHAILQYHFPGLESHGV